MENKQSTMSPLGMVSEGLGVVNQVGQMLGIGQRKQDERQLKQQAALNAQQLAGARTMADYQAQKQLEMWNATNYGAQIDHMKSAGLNPALMYGQGGGGGTTTGAAINTSGGGGQAANAAQTQQAQTAMGMQLAQLRLMEAQTNKTNAEAEKISTTDTKEAEARTTNIAFQNELNKSIGVEQMVKNYGWASDKIQTESEKMNAEYEAWKTTGFAGKAFDDPTSPMAKAMKAGLEKSLEELQQAKLNNDATAAGNVVKQFEARLAEQGIHPHSPWWTKLVTDMLQKVGLIEMVKKAF